MDSIVMNSDVAPELPDGAVPLKNQVAGHRHGMGKTKYGFLQCQDDMVLKAIQGPPRGTREKEFYQRVFQSPHSSEHIIKLRQFIPLYYGIYAKNQMPVEYIKLEDISRQFDKPCIADIKMGKVTSDPEASDEKVFLERSKSPAAADTGFSIIGMRVYNQKEDEFTYYDKSVVRKMVTEDLMYNGIDMFFQAGDQRYHGTIKTVLNKLEKIDAWFSAQRELAFYSSSLLIVYEGNVNDGSNENMIITNSDAMSGIPYDWPVIKPKVKQDKTLADVRMIDFAHVFPTADYDDNYMHGLRNLQKYLKHLLTTKYK